MEKWLDMDLKTMKHVPRGISETLPSWNWKKIYQLLCPGTVTYPDHSKSQRQSPRQALTLIIEPTWRHKQEPADNVQGGAQQDTQSICAPQSHEYSSSIIHASPWDLLPSQERERTKQLQDEPESDKRPAWGSMVPTLTSDTTLDPSSLNDAHFSDPGDLSSHGRDLALAGCFHTSHSAVLSPPADGNGFDPPGYPFLSASDGSLNQGQSSYQATLDETMEMLVPNPNNQDGEWILDRKTATRVY